MTGNTGTGNRGANSGSPVPPSGRSAFPTLRTAALLSLTIHLLVVLVPGSWWVEIGVVGGGGVTGPADAGGSFGATFVVLPYASSATSSPESSDPDPVPIRQTGLSSEVEAAVPLESPVPPELEDLRLFPARTDDAPILPEPEPADPVSPSAGSLDARTGDPAEVDRGGAGARGGTSPQATPVPGAGAGRESREEGRYRPPRMLVGQLPLTSEEAARLAAPEELGVRLRIDIEGNVDRVEFLDPQPGRELADAVRRSALAMRFVPAKLGTRPVEAWFSMTFVFRN